MMVLEAALAFLEMVFAHSSDDYILIETLLTLSIGKRVAIDSV